MFSPAILMAGSLLLEDKIKVLFLCTGNSCRSQIAEGWARHLKGDVVEAFSAGVSPVGVNSRAIKVMAEAGIDLSEHTSKHVDELTAIDFDYIITLCDIAKEQCPVFSSKAKLIHKGFDDPSFVMGTEQRLCQHFEKHGTQ